MWSREFSSIIKLKILSACTCIQWLYCGMKLKMDGSSCREVVTCIVMESVDVAELSSIGGKIRDAPSCAKCTIIAIRSDTGEDRMPQGRGMPCAWRRARDYHFFICQFHFTWSPNSMDMKTWQRHSPQAYPRATFWLVRLYKRLYILVVSPKSCNEAGVDDFEACRIGKGGVFRKRDYIQNSD